MSPSTERDLWAAWLLEGRFGGDPAEERRGLRELEAVRDRVTVNAGLSAGAVLLDVGTGDGLIGRSALDLVGAEGRVLFTDVSRELLGRCRKLVHEAGGSDRAGFAMSSAHALPFRSGSVDAVTTRSVLIYVADKAEAIREFKRVVRSGGRVSIFEPINRFLRQGGGEFWGYDVGAVADLAAKVQAVYDRAQPPDTDPMLDFDERDLLRLFEEAGFEEIHLDLEVIVSPKPWFSSWEAFLRTAGNPLAPTLAEAMAEALQPSEAARFEEHLRPLVDRGRGIKRLAGAYVWGVNG